MKVIAMTTTVGIISTLGIITTLPAQFLFAAPLIGSRDFGIQSNGDK
ncbi:MAG: hypothetical protein WAJ93_01120 [Candidatus Nitrosopolaris sp.]